MSLGDLTKSWIDPAMPNVGLRIAARALNAEAYIWHGRILSNVGLGVAFEALRTILSSALDCGGSASLVRIVSILH